MRCESSKKKIDDKKNIKITNIKIKTKENNQQNCIPPIIPKLSWDD